MFCWALALWTLNFVCNICLISSALDRNFYLKLVEKLVRSPDKDEWRTYFFICKMLQIFYVSDRNNGYIKNYSIYIYIYKMKIPINLIEHCN